ncbi:MAG: hypothetical protein U5K75_11000 [Ahrensia sp.]|nr:hypothetical protein [Ahrensia sp.]
MEAWRTQDRGEWRTQGQPYRLVPSAKQAAQLALYQIADSRERNGIVLALKPQWKGYGPGSCLTLNLPAFGLMNVKCVVIDRQEDAADRVVILTFRTEDDNKHPLALAATGTPPPGVNLVPLDLSNVPAPTSGSWAAVGGQLVNAGVQSPAIIITGATDNPNAENVIFEYRPAGGSDSDWRGGGTDDAATKRKEITSVAAASSYDVAVSYVVRGVISARRVLGPVTTGQQVAGTFVNASEWATFNGISTANMSNRVQYLNGSTGRASTGRVLPTSWSVGIKAIASDFSISDSAAGPSVTVNIAASNRTLDDGMVVSYPSGSIIGVPYATRIYVWRVDPNLDGGSSYGYSTNMADVLGLDKVYLGYWTTRAAASASGGGGSGGSQDCVDAEAFVMLADGTNRKGRDIKAGDKIKITVNDGDQWRVDDIDVEKNKIAENLCVTLISETGITLTLAANTPVVSKQGWDVAANARGLRLPVMDNDGFRFELITEVNYIGSRPVAKIEAHQAIYAAGDQPGRVIFTHNPVYKHR